MKHSDISYEHILSYMKIVKVYPEIDINKL